MGRKSFYNGEDGLKKGSWTPEEDLLLTKFIETQGEGRWLALPRKAGLKRCGKSCRLRWVNYLRPNVKRGNISQDEEELIMRLHKLLGNRWSLIAGRMPGRTDNEVKNYWNTHLSKKAANGLTSGKSHIPSVKEEAAAYDKDTANASKEAQKKKIMGLENLEEEPTLPLDRPPNNWQTKACMEEESNSARSAGFIMDVEEITSFSFLDFDVPSAHLNYLPTLSVANGETGLRIQRENSIAAFSANPPPSNLSMAENVLSYPPLFFNSEGVFQDGYGPYSSHNYPLSLPEFVHSETTPANLCSDFFDPNQWPYSQLDAGVAFNSNDQQEHRILYTSSDLLWPFLFQSERTSDQL